MNRITNKKMQGMIDVTDLQKLYHKLSDYEDTGLEPCEVRNLNTAYDSLMTHNSCVNCYNRYHRCEYAPSEFAGPRINCIYWLSDSNEGG